MARYVTVASVSISPNPKHKDDLPALLKQAETFATRAARMGADIVCFPELYPCILLDLKDRVERAEVVPGETTEYMARVARRHQMYIFWPLMERKGKRVYNSLVLIDREGQVVGSYHKMFPTIGEIEEGITPGRQATVFQTDFGKIGAAICFDLNFPPALEGSARNGAEIIFFSSAYRGGLQLECWAHHLGVYLVSAILAELGRIVDLSGKVLAEATYESVIAKRINLDRRLLHMDSNCAKMDAMLEKYGTGVSFDMFTREAKYTVASEMEDKTVDDLIREFELEEVDHYFARSIRARERALKKAARKGG